MKLTSAMTSKLIAYGVALTGATIFYTAGAQTMQEGKAVTRAVRGSAEYKGTASDPWKKLSVGTTLKTGAVVKTGGDTVVDLFLAANASMVRITANTEMALDKLNFAKAGEDTVIETELNLKAGTILGNVRKLAAASRFDVKYPVGVCGIRGTGFKLGENGACYVSEGKVTLTWSPPGQPSKTVTIDAGHWFDPSDGLVKTIDAAKTAEIKDLQTFTKETEKGDVKVTPSEKKEDIAPEQKPSVVK